MKRLILLLLFLPAGAVPADGINQSPEDFLSEVFQGSVPKAQVLWLRGDVRKTSTAILGHRYPAIRVRYWLQGTRSAWILEETGKDKPITTGLLINGQRIERLRVLIFRESRGWEVKYPFFTDQFPGIGLTPERQLDGRIDGISGATLSVRALEKQARLALYFHNQVVGDHDKTP